MDTIKEYIRLHMNTINFEKIVNFIKDYNDKPAHSMTELRNNKSKQKSGDLFENFAKLYLMQKYNTVWLLSEVPDEHLSKLGLRKNDMGIDIICFHEAQYYAVQVKFRSPNKYKSNTGIPWKQLSTFYALVHKTGPFVKHIVITNVDYVRHVGKKTTKDLSICKKTFENLSTIDYASMIKCQIPIEKSCTTLSNEELRNKRLAYFNHST